MPGLLVSVRSADEAQTALAGGAAVIDVKEPDRGPLGPADPAVWAAVVRAVAGRAPVSVALGELRDRLAALDPGPGEVSGLFFRKLGLAGAGPDWVAAWATLRRTWGGKTPWVAVAYADVSRANSPHPDEVLAAALEIPECVGILVDTYDKSRPNPLDLTWSPWVRRAQEGGLLVTLAGGLDAAAIMRLAPLTPDLFAVRGSACRGGDRLRPLDPACVSLLAQAARSVRRIDDPTRLQPHHG